MKKITFFLPNFLQSGAETVTVSVANYTAKQGHKVQFIVTEKKGALLDDLDPSIEIINLNCGKVINCLPYLIWYFIKNKPHIFFSTLKENNVMTILAKLISCSKSKIILREANTLTSEFSIEKSFLQKIKKQLVKYLYPKADLVIALSEHMKRDMDLFFSNKLKNVEVIYNPVDVDRILYLAKENSELEVDDFSKNKKIIVSVARLHKSKGYDTILTSLKKLKSIGFDFHFYALGEGMDRERLESITHSLELEDCVSFLGFIKNPFPILSKGDCFVLASHFEGMPNSLLQALVLNIPVVCSDSPGASSEVLINGQLGRLFDVENSEQLVEQLIDTLNSNEIINTKVYIEERHNFNKIMSCYYKCIINTVN